MYRLEYNRLVMRSYIASGVGRLISDYCFEKHIKSLHWLDNLQDNVDYRWAGLHHGHRQLTPFCEYIDFAKEEDLLAFRLAIGL